MHPKIVPAVGLVTYVLLCAVIVPAATAAPAAAHALLIERVTWQKRPIPIALEVGAERTIHFPAPVRVGIPERLEGSLRIQNIGDTLYVTARSPFLAMRVLVQSLEEGTTYVLDFSASAAEQPLGPVEIHEPAEVVPGSESAADSPLPDYGYVTLTRFAAQQ